MKQTLRYDQLSCRLEVEGLPDVSASQAANAIGIITTWTLEWAGRPQLEGRKEHLVALMEVVLPYARYLVSGVARRFGRDDQPVEIGPAEGSGHQLLLRSSQSDTPPLAIALDDAELADLVRVLDQVRMDSRLVLPFDLPPEKPLKPREVLRGAPLRQRLAAPLGGAVLVLLASSLSLLLPQPKRSLPTIQESAKPTLPQSTPGRP